MPFGFGRGGGRGRGGGGRGGRGRGRGHRGARRMLGVNRIENCICPSCGTIIPHQAGFPCFQTMCPNCNSAMTRQFNVPGIYTPTEPAATAQKPVVDPELCTGCQKCIRVCPEGAIEMLADKAVIRAEKCTNCRICIPACPFAAIR